jgi:hypothetical protein
MLVPTTSACSPIRFMMHLPSSPASICRVPLVRCWHRTGFTGLSARPSQIRQTRSRPIRGAVGGEP